MRFDKQSIIVTGGANGIGRVYCEHLVSEGGRVLIADIDGEAANSLAVALNEGSDNPRAIPIRADVTSESDTRIMSAAAVDAFGRIDVLINNAGIYPHRAFDDITYEDWRKVMSINLDSAFLCSKAVLPQMKIQRSGKIINVATNLVWIGLAGMVHYVASKAAVIGLTRSLAREVGEYGITVNALAPGAIIPPLERLNSPARSKVEEIINYQSVKWHQTAADLIGPMLFLASSASNFVSGQILTVDGGLTSH